MGIIIAGEKYEIGEYFGVNSSIPDCMVKGPNKIGNAHGEAKFYISNKDVMRKFYGDEGFEAKVIMLKSDLLEYMQSIKNEYMSPTYPYGVRYNSNRKEKKLLPELWDKRFKMICELPDVISFTISDQTQISGPRGYVNSEDEYYQIIREIALPESSFISACKLKTSKGTFIFYWKLFVDYIRLQNEHYTPLSLSYGQDSSNHTQREEHNEVDSEKEKDREESRRGQGKYRKELLRQMPFCPCSGISDDRLLIASHIKPWAVSNDSEKIDPYNGYMLSPMFDKLFDKGFITFTEDRRIHLSEKITDWTYSLIGIKENEQFQNLPMDDKRINYLEFHRKNVFQDFARFS